MIGGIRTSLGVSDDPMFLWISSNSCPLNLLLVRSHQAEIIFVKRLIQGRNNVTRVRVEPRPFDQGRRKNDAFTHSATLPTLVQSSRPLLVTKMEKFFLGSQNTVNKYKSLLKYLQSFYQVCVSV